MKSKTAEMDEGQAAFDRFRNAVKGIVSVRESDVVASHHKASRKKKGPANPQGLTDDGSTHLPAALQNSEALVCHVC